MGRNIRPVVVAEVGVAQFASINKPAEEVRYAFQ
jgi:hypothetical protein